MNVKLHQKITPPKQSDVDKHRHWVMLFADEIDSRCPYAQRLITKKKLLKNKRDEASVVTCELPNERASYLSFTCIENAPSSFELLTLAKKLIAKHEEAAPSTLALAVFGFDPAKAERVAEAVVAAALADAAQMPVFKSAGRQRTAKYSTLHIFGVKEAQGFSRTRAEAEGNALARSLSITPPNKLTPSLYLRQIKKLAKQHQWELDFYDTATLRKYKAGAFLAVSQGSATDDAGIVRLKYRRRAKSGGNALALLGKGICYDTGGVNLKPARHMFGMHEDMQGSAVALGVLLALTRLEVNFAVECWLALAMNHIGAKAYKPNDVVTASDGTTIEVMHTDAEGRMVLADTLALASKTKPSLIIDYATLTGACINALGTAYSGAFTNREAYIPALLEAGKRSGERVWPFPMDADYDQALESDIADVKQCSLDPDADHILAARFLRRFVKHDAPWVHIDLSSSHHSGGLAHVPTDTTGFGIRFTLSLLLDQNVYP